MLGYTDTRGKGGGVLLKYCILETIRKPNKINGVGNLTIA